MTNTIATASKAGSGSAALQARGLMKRFGAFAGYQRCVPGPGAW